MAMGVLGLQEPGSGAADVGRDTGSHSPTRTISMGDGKGRFLGR